MNNNPAPFCQIRKVLREIEKLDIVLTEHHDVSLDEAIILCCLSRKCRCQSNLAQETGLSPVKASRLLSRLEAKGLIERSMGKEDKRQMIFTLSRSGQDRLEIITPLAKEYLNPKNQDKE